VSAFRTSQWIESKQIHTDGVRIDDVHARRPVVIWCAERKYDTLCTL